MMLLKLRFLFELVYFVQFM